MNRKVDKFFIFYVIFSIFSILYLIFIKFIQQPGLPVLVCFVIILILYHRTKKKSKKESNRCIWLDIIIYSLFILFTLIDLKNEFLEINLILILWALNLFINLMLTAQLLDNQSVNLSLFILLLSIVFTIFDLPVVISACLLIYSLYKKYLDVCKQRKINIKQIDYKLEQIEYYSITLTGISVVNSILAELLKHKNNIIFVLLKYCSSRLIDNSHHLNNSILDFFSSIVATIFIFIIVIAVKLILQKVINTIVKKKNK